jgi:arginyl-tRNA synthetase
MKHDIERVLITVIQDVLKELDLGRLLQKKIYLDFPSDHRFGDLSTNIALQLSKIVKRPPQEIAKTIVDRIKTKLEKSPYQDYVREVKAEGAGFINFYIHDKYFYEEIKNLIVKPKDALRQNTGKNKKVLIEFVSANPTGPLSVAHARQAVVGDALANILGFLGFQVKREYYLNDEGNQIDILGRSVELRLKELEGEKIEYPENYYQGDYIYDIAKKSQVTSHKSQDLGEFAAQYILGIIKKELDDFGVEFDYWSSQKKLRKSGKIEQALDFLKGKGFLYEQDSALWFKSTAFGDDKDRVVIKSDGSYTYLAPDIAYHQEKYKRGFDWLINFWGPDHHGYVPRLKAAIQALGYAPDSLSIIIVQLASIFREGKSIEMSTRKGQYITLREVLDEVGPDASRFFFLMRRTSSHLDFDLGTAKKQTPENPVYYVQYAHARICNILSKSRINFKEPLDFSILKEKEELALIKKLLRFSCTLNICLNTQDPYMLTVYLQELAETFHKFYDLHRVLGDDDTLTKVRLSLIEAAKVVIAKGLDLLGISKPEKM